MEEKKNLWIKDIPYQVIKHYDKDYAKWQIISLPASLLLLASVTFLVYAFFAPDFLIRDGWGVPWSKDPIMPHKMLTGAIAVFTSLWLILTRKTIVFDDSRARMRYREGLGHWQEYPYQGIVLECISYRILWRFYIHTLWAAMQDGNMRFLWGWFHNNAYNKYIYNELARRVSCAATGK